MVESFPEAGADYLVEGLVLAHLWVGLCLGPLVGRIIYIVMSIGSYGLRNSLGILSTDGWVCVPAQLIV